MEKIIELNYEAAIKRGVINKDTTGKDFIMKLEEETQEFINAFLYEDGNENYELADIILVCLNIAKHYNIDIEKQLLINIGKNYHR